jgi:hypothetical protein
MDEMERNSDERENLTIYRYFVILSIIINLFMNFTWKLSRKDNKFPAMLVNGLFIAFNMKLLIIFIMQSIKRDPLL